MQTLRGRLPFLGTGTSEGIPRVYCLTQPNAQQACPVCWSAWFHEGSRNRRRNTGIVLQVPREDGRDWTVGIDCGKMWWERAVRAFPKTDLQRLDAMVLTHWHADAILGLDDLRDFTQNIKDDDGFLGLTVHSNEATQEMVNRIFPYLVQSPEDKKLEDTGGGVATEAFNTFCDFVTTHSDINAFPEGSQEYLRGAKQVVIDGLRHEEVHLSYFTIAQTLEELKNGFLHGAGSRRGVARWDVPRSGSRHHEHLASESGIACRIVCAYDTQQFVFEIYDHGSEISLSVDTQ